MSFKENSPSPVLILLKGFLPSKPNAGPTSRRCLFGRHVPLRALDRSQEMSLPPLPIILVLQTA